MSVALIISAAVVILVNTLCNDVVSQSNVTVAIFKKHIIFREEVKVSDIKNWRELQKCNYCI